MRSASCSHTTPICCPSGPTRRTSGDRIRSFTRGSAAIQHHLFHSLSRRHLIVRTWIAGRKTGVQRTPDPILRNHPSLGSAGEGVPFLCVRDGQYTGPRRAMSRSLKENVLRKPQDVRTSRAAGSGRTNVGRLLTLRPFDDVELHLLTLGEGAVPLHLDRGVVYEHVVAVGPR